MLPDLFPELDLSNVPRIGGVPRFIYRQAASQLWKYAKTIGRADALALLIEEVKALQYLGLFSECWKRSMRRGRRQSVQLGTPIARPLTPCSSIRRFTRCSWRWSSSCTGASGWRSQNRMLLAASYVFYGWWDVRFLGLIAVSTVVDYYCARAIASSSDVARRRWLLIASLAVNLGFLGAFKYFNFFVDSFAAVLESLGLPPGAGHDAAYPAAAGHLVLHVPGGRIHRRRVPPQARAGRLAGRLRAVHQPVPAPDRRPDPAARHLLPQVQAPRVFDQERFFDGLMLILSGLFRKAVIADNCALHRRTRRFPDDSGPPNLADYDARHLRVRVADLRRLQRLQRHRARQRAAARLPLHGELPAAVPRDEPAGFLAALAHQPEHVAARLPVHPARRQSARRGDDVPQPDADDAARRPVARRELDVRRVGRAFTAPGWRSSGSSRERWDCRSDRTAAVAHRQSAARHGDEQFDLRPASLDLAHRRSSIWCALPGSSSVPRACTPRSPCSAACAHSSWAPGYTIALRFLALFAIPLFVMDVINETRGEEYVFETAVETRRVAVGVALMAVVAVFAANQLNAFIYFRF